MMSQNQNAWLFSYGRRVSVLIQQLEEQRLMGGYNEKLNLAEVITLLQSTQTEIVRQDGEIQALNERIKVLGDALSNVGKTDETVDETIKG